MTSSLYFPPGINVPVLTASSSAFGHVMIAIRYCFRSQIWSLCMYIFIFNALVYCVCRLCRTTQKRETRKQISGAYCSFIPAISATVYIFDEPSIMLWLMQ